MTDSAQHQVLYALFCLSRDTRHISATTLAAEVGLTPTLAARTLVALERAGLVDASRARLTLLGLATAVRLGPAASGTGAKRAMSAAVARIPAPAEQPLAARPHDSAPCPAVATVAATTETRAACAPSWTAGEAPASMGGCIGR
jgi:DNA-binding IclR family transcriptional regulator